MELLAYWRLLRRRWPLVLIPALLALVVGLLTYRPAPPLYNAGVRFIAGQRPTIGSATSDEERNNSWTASEYLVNSLTDWVRTGHFAALVSQELAGQGFEVAPAAIVAGTAADSSRSTMTLMMSYSDPAVLEAMMRAAMRVLSERNAEALPQLGGEPAEVVALDEPIINRVPAGIRGQLELPLRIVLALAAGVGVALLADYLDPTLRRREEIEAMGIAVLGEIPPK
jgi:capsular polysaccharide biosynthesis protein